MRKLTTANSLSVLSLTTSHAFEDDLEQTESFRLALPAYQASYHALSDLEPIQIILPN